MSCGPGKVSGPGAVPFWSTCYDVNSDMGSYLTSAEPQFRAELSDPNFVWRHFGKKPQDEAGRVRIATEGPSYLEQFQASLAALHPMLGSDDVAKGMYDGGKALVLQLRGSALPDDTPQLVAALADKDLKEKALKIVAYMTAPLALKYGPLAKAVHGQVFAGALAGASVLIYGAVTGQVQRALGQQMNELHSTSGKLANKAPAPPWEGYRPGDWVTMRMLADGAFTKRIGLVLAGSKTGRRYTRYDIAVFPSSDLVGRESTDLALLQQETMWAAADTDPKIRVWVNAMVAKFKAQSETCGLKRRKLMFSEGDELVEDHFGCGVSLDDLRIWGERLDRKKKAIERIQERITALQSDEPLEEDNEVQEDLFHEVIDSLMASWVLKKDAWNIDLKDWQAASGILPEKDTVPTPAPTPAGPSVPRALGAKEDREFSAAIPLAVLAVLVVGFFVFASK